MREEGISLFIKDLKINPMDPVTLVISYYFKAETMGVFKKEEFLQGMQALGCESIQQLQKALPNLRNQLSNKTQFKEIYRFAFLFCRDPGAKNIP